MQRTSIALTLAASLFAQPAHAKLYKWVNEQGETVFSDTPPVQIGSGHDVLNKRGMTVESIGKALSAQERAAAAQALAAQRAADAQRKERARIDNLLRHSFPTQEALQSARADRLDTVDDSIGYLSKRREGVLSKHQRNAQRIENFHRKELAIPTQLTLERSQLTRSLENIDQQIAAIKADRKAIVAEFDAYKKRLSELQAEDKARSARGH